MSSSYLPARVGRALADFAVEAQWSFEEDVITADVLDSALPVGLELLSNARSNLEDEIRSGSRNSATDVDAWIENAKALQYDIAASKRLANQIIRETEVEEQREQSIQDQEKHISFLDHEMDYNSMLKSDLKMIQATNKALDRAELHINNRHVFECLETLQVISKEMTVVPSASVGRLLEERVSNLQSNATDLLRSVWESMIVVDRSGGRITILENLGHEIIRPTIASNSGIALATLDDQVEIFWRTLDDVIVKPRTDLARGTLRCIHVEGNMVYLGDETADTTITSLFTAMNELVVYLTSALPEQFVQRLALVMMPDLTARLESFWLDTAVPSSLDDMDEYRKSLLQVAEFGENLQFIGWPHVEFEKWVHEAAKMWITKRRETVLDWTRHQLEFGVGTPCKSQHFEKQMVDKYEGNQIAYSADVQIHGWDSAWGTEEDDIQSSNGGSRLSMDEGRRASQVTVPEPEVSDDKEQDDSADAWGWGDDDAADNSTQNDLSGPADGGAPEFREITLSEEYHASSLPAPIFKTITDLFKDGARLASDEFKSSPIAAAAPSLFTLPRLVLTLYRAVSPHHYALHEAGNMFAYNDSIWLCDELAKFQVSWDARSDLGPRALGKVKVDSEIKVLHSFGKRAYTSELNAQRTVLTDLLGGAQNFFSEDGLFNAELDARMENVIMHVRSIAELWKPILQYSAWVSAVGSLANTIASKIVIDVFDLDSLSEEGAAKVTELISKVLEIGDIFKSNARRRSLLTEGLQRVQPAPASVEQFADRWMKLISLKVVLAPDTDMDTLRFLWTDTSLSLNMTAEEVIELIDLSFQNNMASRQLKRDIRDNPSPEIKG